MNDGNIYYNSSSARHQLRKASAAHRGKGITVLLEGIDFFFFFWYCENRIMSKTKQTCEMNGGELVRL